MDRPPSRIRTLALLLSGLIDGLIGSILLLSWLGILPLDLRGIGLTRNWVGLIGAVLAISGVVVVTYQLTKIREPDE
ncbi:MAG: hypothetical protein AB1531_00855 [Chloroflexota bacterium]